MPGVKPRRTPSTRFRTGATGLCTGRPVLARCDRPVRQLVQRRVWRRRLCTSWARFFCSKRLLLPRTINTPSPTLEKTRLPFKSYPCLHSLSPPLKSIQSLRISHSTDSNPNPFGRKIEETPIYISTKPNLIPPCVHRVLLVTLGFVGNPRQLGSPGGIRLVIHPVESL
jgi:hypothetical protein